MFRPLSVFNRNRNAPAARDDGADDPFFQFHREMNRLFDDFLTDFGAPSMLAGAAATDARPIHIEINDRDDAFELEAELPGVDEDDVHVELVDNLLTIRGEKKVEEEEGENGVSRRAYSSFQRSMSLPFDVDPEAVEARIRNGVLKLTLPKPPELEVKSRRIEIKRG